MLPLSVVVVNWNTLDMLTRCLDTLKGSVRIQHEVVVVDNGSTDGSAKMLGARADVRTVLLPENRGYAGGNNAGIGTASGEAVCLLNSDAFVTRGALESLVETVRQPGVGLAGPCTNRARGLQRRKPWLGFIPPPFRPVCETDFLSFFCVMVRREVLVSVGLLDERFKIGTYEDNDYCRRVKAAGWKLMVDGRAWVWHEEHSTFLANRLDDVKVMDHNRAVFEEKWGPGSCDQT